MNKFPKRKGNTTNSAKTHRELLTRMGYSKDIKLVFNKILTEIKSRVESAKSLHENLAFLSGHAFLNMSTVDLQARGVDLARKYSKDLNVVDFCQELAVFKDLC
ncbi:hypothetical protein HHI36_005735, partial [Cryptolaemus montrouzieri]